MSFGSMREMQRGRVGRNVGVHLLLIPGVKVQRLHLPAEPIRISRRQGLAEGRAPLGVQVLQPAEVDGEV
ncbi:hypothetical protein C8J43_102612 [Sphingomonas sp. PP-CE-1G-424]|nr:hypothetical protein C8J43_102612 [Sphingomonas sp. PP-CE-1G-424]